MQMLDVSFQITGQKWRMYSERLQSPRCSHRSISIKVCKVRISVIGACRGECLLYEYDPCDRCIAYDHRDSSIHRFRDNLFCQRGWVVTISAQLKDTPSISDRAIAGMLGVNHETVRGVRTKLE